MQRSLRHALTTHFGRVSQIIIVTGLTSLLTDFSSEMIVPILPLFLTSVLHVTVSDVGVIEGIAESTASVLKLFSGWISDRLGRRKPLIVLGYALSNITKPLFALSGSWGQVLAVRFVDRIGKGVRGAPRDALIADATTKQERGKGFGFHRAMDTLGAAIGPLVAFFILMDFKGNYRTIFWVSAVPGILAVLLLIFFLKEKRNGATHENTGSLPQLGFKSLGRRFMLFSVVTTLFALGNSSDAFLILRAQSVGMPATFIPLAYFTFNMVYAVFALPVGIWSDRIGRRTVIVTGYLIFAGIYLGFGLAKNSTWIWGLFIVYGLYYAATDGIQKAYIGDVVSTGQRGMAMGTFNAMTGLAALPASMVAGILWQGFGPMATFGVGTVCALAAAALMMIFRV